MKINLHGSFFLQLGDRLLVLTAELVASAESSPVIAENKKINEKNYQASINNLNYINFTSRFYKKDYSRHG